MYTSTHHRSGHFAISRISRQLSWFLQTSESCVAVQLWMAWGGWPSIRGIFVKSFKHVKKLGYQENNKQLRSSSSTRNGCSFGRTLQVPPVHPALDSEASLVTTSLGGFHGIPHCKFKAAKKKLIQHHSDSWYNKNKLTAGWHHRITTATETPPITWRYVFDVNKNWKFNATRAVCWGTVHHSYFLKPFHGVWMIIQWSFQEPKLEVPQYTYHI